MYFSDRRLDNAWILIAFFLPVPLLFQQVYLFQISGSGHELIGIFGWELHSQKPQRTQYNIAR
jgi:hypothetical protein